MDVVHVDVTHVASGRASRAVKRIARINQMSEDQGIGKSASPVFRIRGRNV
jgi:hypothetical protein